LNACRSPQASRDYRTYLINAPAAFMRWVLVASAAAEI
jgi:hypothetical protein